MVLPQRRWRPRRFDPNKTFGGRYKAIKPKENPEKHMENLGKPMEHLGKPKKNKET
jgi:hypothetical protein